MLTGGRNIILFIIYHTTDMGGLFHDITKLNSLSFIICTVLEAYDNGPPIIFTTGWIICCISGNLNLIVNVEDFWLNFTAEVRVLSGKLGQQDRKH